MKIKDILNINIVNLKKLIDDQYSCTECSLIPEILKIYYDTKEIQFKCDIHGDKKIHLVDFFRNELNYKCEICNTEIFGKESTSQEFKYCFDCNKVICPNCFKPHKKEHKYIVPICEMHLKNKHAPKQLLQENIVSNQLETIGDPQENEKVIIDNKNNITEKNLFDYKPSESDIEVIKNKNIELKNRIKSLRILIKMNNILLTTYEKHPENYHNNKNITNVANSIMGEGGPASNIDEKDSDVRIKKIEKILLDIINNKLSTKFTGKEKTIDLSNKSIGDIEFKLFSCISFNNLEELNFQKNSIANIDTLSIFNAPKLKMLDLSSNQITSISCLRNASSGFPNLEKLLLNLNKINNIEVLKDSIFPKLSHINLDNNYFDYSSNRNRNILTKYYKIDNSGQNLNYDLR